jgi:plasmid stabilization system protein ParE
MPGLGHERKALTSQNVLFWPVHSYLVVYKDSKPLRIVRLIHGRRDVKRILKKG